MNRRGQARLIELLLASFMMVVAIIFAMSFTRPVKSIYVRETSDLRRLAYNLLNDYAKAGVYERIIVMGNLTGADWEDEMRLMLSTSLPPEIVFKMEVYELRYSTLTGEIRMVRLDTGRITNIKSPAITHIQEAESVSYTYVVVGKPDRVRGTVLYIVLVLGFGG